MLHFIAGLPARQLDRLQSVLNQRQDWSTRQEEVITSLRCSMICTGCESRSGSSFDLLSSSTAACLALRLNTSLANCSVSQTLSHADGYVHRRHRCFLCRGRATAPSVIARSLSQVPKCGTVSHHRSSRFRRCYHSGEHSRRNFSIVRLVIIRP